MRKIEAGKLPETAKKLVIWGFSCKISGSSHAICYEYLDLNNSTSASFEGLYRKDHRDFPENAVREALLNSLVHRDYSYSASTLISIYSDRMEFVSVGGLLPGIQI